MLLTSVDVDGTAFRRTVLDEVAALRAYLIEIAGRREKLRSAIFRLPQRCRSDEAPAAFGD